MNAKAPAIFISSSIAFNGLRYTYLQKDSSLGF